MAIMKNFIDSFKAKKLEGGSPGADVEKASLDNVRDLGNDQYSNVQGVVVDDQGRRLTTAETGLKRNLSGRHMQMIAFGGAIGTGLFIGSGGALSTGGPASLLMDFIIMGVLLACTVLALGEMATTLPVAGSFAAYSSRFIDPAWGFAMGWNYWMQWFVVLPLELVAASIVIDYWDPNATIPRGVWVVIFIVAISIINFFGVRGYGEFEFIASMVKILAILGFIIAGIVINCGGAPNGQYLGDNAWYAEPGLAFRNGFKGWCSVFVTAAFAFAGTELIGLAAAESADPRKEVPKATKQVFYRIFFFYIVTLLLVTLIVPASDPRLLGGTSSYDARASPFVIAINIGQIKVLPSIFNAVILVSVLSVGNSSVYGASRTLSGLAQMGLAPKIFCFIDRAGRPVPAVVLSLLFGFLAFLVYSASQNDVFNWLYATCGLSSIFTWGSICLCHIRFRKAWKLQGLTKEHLPWASPMGVWGSWLGLALNIIVLIAQFYKAGWPIGEGDMTGSERAVNFFQSYLSAPIVLVFWAIGYFVVQGAGWVPVSQIDVTTGRREAPSLEVLRAERQAIKDQPFYKRVASFLF
ncbi:putative GAP1-amino acid transport protein [Microstroma glucosiphilum]|uniref:Putative GAP1-amino acid transport protein n=1 Tax=Pseudomicrostroma glucosiphilum TaxID=1684307 RepID=A0A316U7K0_9BASI|nr:putative GAP1-amino acid transport protein [Pseudomicrostroma glucosiphilum]PWN20421.1 putative GAP1-amino acid transport protein [Pseudomicrostroma glucosiphilum]